MEEKATHIPRGVILGAMTFSHAITSFGNLSIPPLTPFLREDLGLSHAQVGMLMSFFYMGVVAASIPAGWVSDRLGERRILMMGLGVQGVFLTAFAGVHSFFLGGVFLILAGVGYSSVNPATTKGVMRWFPPQGRATAMGVKQTGIPLGGILAAALLPGLALHFGWRPSLVLVGLLTLAFILVVRAAIPPAPPASAREPRQRANSFRRVLLDRNILALSVMGIFLAGAQLSILTHLVLFLKSQFLFSSVLAGIFLAATQAGGIAGRIGWGLASDYLARGRRKAVLGVIGVVALSQIVLLSRAGAGLSLGWLFLIVGILGSTAIGFHGVLFGILGETAGKEAAGLVTGFSLAITFLGIVLFPPLFGLLVDRLNSYDRAWDMVALCWVAALLILFFFVKEAPPGAKQEIDPGR